MKEKPAFIFLYLSGISSERGGFDCNLFSAVSRFVQLPPVVTLP